LKAFLGGAGVLDYSKKQSVLTLGLHYWQFNNNGGSFAHPFAFDPYFAAVGVYNRAALIQAYAGSA
jgi:hypothetical protein